MNNMDLHIIFSVYIILHSFLGPRILKDSLEGLIKWVTDDTRWIVHLTAHHR